MVRLARTLIIAFLLALMPVLGWADGRQPFLLHALGDLRTARWMLERRADGPAVRVHEDRAIERIDQAIAEVTQQARDDGREHPGFDLPRSHRDRLGKTVELLRRIDADLGRDVESGVVRALEQRAREHVGQALHEVEAAAGRG